MSNQQNQNKIPTPPKVKFAEQGKLEKLIENLKNWAAYEAAHLSVHQHLMQQLGACQPGTEDFSNILFAVKLSGIKSKYCEDNITALQERIITALPMETNDNGQKTGMPDFNILAKFLVAKKESPHPIQ